MFQIPGKAVLLGGVIPALGVDGAVYHLAAVGEEHGRVAAPDAGVCLPDVLHAVALPLNADDLRALGGDGDFQIAVFKNVLHGKEPP